jgi:hypothetical protein
MGFLVLAILWCVNELIFEGNIVTIPIVWWIGSRHGGTVRA